MARGRGWRWRPPACGGTSDFPPLPLCSFFPPPTPSWRAPFPPLKQRSEGTRGLSVSTLWLLCRTANKKVIYSQPAARSEVSTPPWTGSLARQRGL